MRGLATHCNDPRANYSRQAIPDGLVGDSVALEMDPGDVLFMTKLTMHASLPNSQPGHSLERVLPDAEAWAALWHQARERLAAGPPPSFQRWPEGTLDCA